MLELGGDSGQVAAHLARFYPHIRLVVTDVDPAMVARANRELVDLPNARAQVADVTALPFADASFDTVLSFLTLHHVLDWEAGLVEAGRVLRPGRRFLAYDLLDRRATRLVHRLDRSPRRLVQLEEFTPALASTALDLASARTAFGGHVFRVDAATATADEEESLL